jgi:RHS repeat-associated protein
MRIGISEYHVGEWCELKWDDFLYDAGGNRFCKRQYSYNSSDTIDFPNLLRNINYYFRDASGNTLAVTELDNTALQGIHSGNWGIGSGACKMGYPKFSTDWYIYGNAAQGQFAEVKSYPSQTDVFQWNTPLDFIAAPFSSPLPGEEFILASDTLNSTDYTHYKFYKEYYLKDHLGNIRLKFSDARLTESTLDITGVYNYYPFGQLIDNKTFESSAGRFGFQSQERDDEVSGKGNRTHYQARDYMGQIGRPDKIDPLSDEFPNQSPYVMNNNNPVYRIDVDGMVGSATAWHMGVYNATYAGPKHAGMSDEQISELQQQTGKAGLIMGGITFSVWGAVLAGPAAIPALESVGQKVVQIGGKTYLAWRCLDPDGTKTVGTALSLIDENPYNDYPGFWDDLIRGGKIVLKSHGPSIVNFIYKFSGHGGDIAFSSTRTTTVLGRYFGGTQELLDNKIHKLEGVNMLDVEGVSPEDWKNKYNTKTKEGQDNFWKDFNKKFLDDAIERGDVIRLVSDPTKKGNLIDQNGMQTTFGREYEYLKGKGYDYNSNTNEMEKGNE